MCNGKEAGSLRMSRKAAKESNVCVWGRLGREWMDVKKRKKNRWDGRF